MKPSSEPGNRHCESCTEPSVPVEVLLEMTPLVRKIARALSPLDPQLREDLVQEGLLALILSFSLYDPGRGPLAPFARRCARNRMISYLRRIRPCFTMTEEEMDEIAVEEQPDEGIDLDNARASLFNLLSPFELACMDAYLYTGSGTGAAEILGWPPKKVENALTRIRRKARLVRGTM